MKSAVSIRYKKNKKTCCRLSVDSQDKTGGIQKKKKLERSKNEACEY